jgi:hypothetical protein
MMVPASVPLGPTTSTRQSRTAPHQTREVAAKQDCDVAMTPRDAQMTLA